MKLASLISLITVLFLSIACTKIVTVDTPSGVPEVAYCTTNNVFASSYTITGSAYYKRRVFDGSGLGAVDAFDYPIRRAEVQVLDAAGEIVQCTETDASGDYSFTVPDDGQTYTVKVLSRSYNLFSKASVLKDPTNNIPYSISQSFSATSSQALADLTAEADESSDSAVTGGAFNILDQIYKTNIFLLTEAIFNVDHKVQAYWKAGVNPVTYFGGDANSGVSFYIPGTDKLYILGGIGGDITTEDTDHFDNAVVVHEYGHFLEDNYSESDSPGGAHYGMYTVDPRLAWSEGFSTFIATQGLGDPIYRDTIGIGGGYGFYYDAENNDDISGNPMDMPTAGQLGEGGFRELAVVRSLWAAADVNVGLMPFSELWSIYTNEFANTLKFREMSLFLQEQAGALGATDISGLYTDNDKELDETRAHYGTVDNSGTANNGADPLCLWTFNPADPIPVSGNAFATSDQFYSNDFFYFTHPGGSFSVTLTYDVGTPGSASDLDLYVYKDGYTFGTASSLVDYSNLEKCGTGDCETGTETIVATAPAGTYMINVMYYNNSLASPSNVYMISVGGDLICR